MNNCQFCSMDTAGKHQPHCPNNQDTNTSSMDRFFDALKDSATEYKPRPAQVLIGEYIELLSAYAMTVDTMELAGEELGMERLKKVVQFIENALDKKLDEIAALQEEADDEKSK